MTSRYYTSPTLKKLFALSGNQCACPECSEIMVNEQRDVFGEICHIRGLEQNSKRHDSSLTIPQMNDYENLIVLCPNHHTKADLEPDTYTIEYLETMKKKHEEKFISNPYDVDENTLQALQYHFKQRQININESNGTQLNTQSGNIQNYTINNIVDLEKFGQVIFENNYPRILSNVTDIAKASAMEYIQTLMEKAKTELTEEDIPSFSDPDLQYMLTQTVIATGRNNDLKLRKNLASLMIGRIKNSKTDLKKIVYDEAIKTLPKLTENQLKIITACFLLRNVKFGEISDIKQFEIAYTPILKELLNFRETNAEIQHIVFTGMGSLSIGSWSLATILKGNYPNLDTENALKTDVGQKITEFLGQSQLKNMNITSVGIVIATMYYEELSHQKVDINHFIN